MILITNRWLVMGTLADSKMNQEISSTIKVLAVMIHCIINDYRKFNVGH